MVIIFVLPIYAETLHVSPSGSDDQGNGTEASPFASIQYGLLQTESGDTVLVHTGEYVISSDIIVNTGIALTLQPGVSVRFDNLKKIDIYGTLIAEGTDLLPIIFTSNYSEPNPGDWQSINFIYSNESVMKNCLIQYASFNEEGYMYYGAISCDNSSPLIEKCIIENNERWGIVCHDNSHPIIQENDVRYNGWDGVKIHNDSSPHILNNKIYGNGADTTNVYNGIVFNTGGNPVIQRNLVFHHYGAGIFAHDITSFDKIIGNTIVHNAVGIQLNNADVHIKNSIIWMNQFSLDIGGTNVLDITYSSIQHGWDGEGNTSEYPHFIDPDNNNYQLHSYSPCVDAGDPDTDNDGEDWNTDTDDQDPDGTRIDMGVFYTDYQDTTGSIYGTINIPGGYSGYLWYGIWFPGMDLNNDDPHIGKDSIEVINGGSFEFMFERLPVGEGYVVQSILDQTGSPVWGPDGCDEGFDLIGGSDMLTVSLEQDTQTGFSLLPCDEYIIGDYSLSLNGTDTYVAVENSTQLNPETITVSSWIYPRSWTSNHRIIQKGSIDSQYFIEAAGDHLEWVVNENANVIITNLPPTETWTHIAGTYDGTTAKLFINHELVSSAFIGEGLNVSSDPMIVGAKIEDDTKVDFFDGLIHDVAIWNRPLNETEIHIIMLNPMEIDNLVGYWPLDHGFGSIAYDRSPYEQYGTIQNYWWENNIPPSPDLSANLGIESFIIPSMAEPGQVLNNDLLLNIFNDGTVLADSFSIGLYISEDSTIVPEEDTQLIGGFERIYDLQYGDTIDVQFFNIVSIPENLEPGEWFIGPYLDDNGEISEVDETDNWMSAAVFIADINQSPTVSITSIEGELHDTITGEISFFDPEGDLLVCSFLYSTDNMEWISATVDTIGLVTDSTCGFSWFTLDDLGQTYEPEVWFKGVVSDGSNTEEAITGPFSIDNFVGEIQLDELFYTEEVSGHVQIPYQIIDSTEDSFVIAIQYSADGGINWNIATILNNIDDIGVDSYTDTLTWNSIEDIPNTDTSVLLFGTIYDGWEQSNSDTISIHVDNQTLPMLTDSGLEIKRWNQEVIIYFSEDLDPETLSDGITLTSTHFEYDQIHIEYQPQSFAVSIFPDSGWAGGDSLIIEISTSLTNIWGNPFDGNENGDPDGENDHRTFTYFIDYLGDNNQDMSINFEDLVYFQQTWWSDEINVTDDIGPSNGVPPYLQPVSDGLIDFEDLMVFVQMWNWSHDAGLSRGRSNKYVGNRDSEEVWFTVTEDSTQVFNIQIHIDAISREIGSLEFIMTYDPQSMDLFEYSSSVADDWVALIYHDEMSPQLKYNLADFNCISTGVNSTPINFTFKKIGSELTPCHWTFDGRDYKGESILFIEKTSVLEITDPIPEKFALHPNYPNPFNPKTTIRYDIAKDSHVDLAVYNLMGQNLVSLINKNETAGSKSVTWDGKDQFGKEVCSGMYFVVLRSVEFIATQKVILLR